MCDIRADVAVQVKAETAHVSLNITLTGSHGAFNLTVLGMSVTCYELQLSDDVFSSTSSLVAAQNRNHLRE